MAILSHKTKLTCLNNTVAVHTHSQGAFCRVNIARQRLREAFTAKKKRSIVPTGVGWGSEDLKTGELNSLEGRGQN